MNRRLYWWAFLLRVAAGLAAYLVDRLTDVPLLGDAAFYEAMGDAVARDWLAGRSTDFETLPQGARSNWLLVLVIAGFYYTTGGIRAIPLLLIGYSAVTALVPVFVRRFALELGSPESVATRAAWLVALSPAFVFWSGSLYKEGFTLLFLSLAAYHTLKLQTRWQTRSVTVLAFCGLGLWGLRYYLAILLVVAMVLALLWGRRIAAPRGEAIAGRMRLRQAIVAFVFLGLMLAVGLTDRAERVLFVTEQEILTDLDTRREWSATAAGSGYLQEARISTSEQAVQYLPLGLLHFVTVPLPWQVGSLRQNLIIPENVFWLLLYPLIVLGAVRGFRVNPSGTIFLVMMTAGMCLMYALLVANVGTAYRMRTQVWLLWAPFAAWGWEIWRSRPRRVQMPTRVRRAAHRLTPGAARALRRTVDRAR